MDDEYKTFIEKEIEDKDSIGSKSYSGKERTGYDLNEEAFHYNQQNVLVFYDGKHSHYFYDPAHLRNGYHGENFVTKHNKPVKEEKEKEDMKQVSKDDYNQGVQQLKDYVKYDSLDPETQKIVDAQIQEMTESHNINVTTATSDNEEDDMQNRDDIDNGIPPGPEDNDGPNNDGPDIGGGDDEER